MFKFIIVDPMLRHGVLPLVISSIALALFLKEAVKDFYSSQAQPFPVLINAGRRPFLRRSDSQSKPDGAGRCDCNGRRPASDAQQDARSAA